MKRTPIRHVSHKRAAENKVRARVLVDIRYERGGMCEFKGCKSEASDGHEPLTRARQGSITDPKNIRLVCRVHHRWIHDHPAEATAEGWLVSGHRQVRKGIS